MATTKATMSRVLLAMILVASIQVQAQHLPPPPSTAGGGRRCSPAVVANLGVCVAMQQGRLKLEDWDQCCRQIRFQDPECLCAAFAVSDARARVLTTFNDQRGEIIRVACGEAALTGFTCPLSAPAG